MLVFVSGANSTLGNSVPDASDDAASIVEGSVGWSQLIDAGSFAESTKADRFINAMANNIGHEIAVTLGVGMENDSVTLLDPAVREVTQNLAFSGVAHAQLMEAAGESGRAYAVVLSPGVLTINGSALGDEISITTGGSSEAHAWQIQGVDAKAIYLDASDQPDHNSINRYAAAITTILFSGHDGDDVFTVDASIMAEVSADGGAGDDKITTGGGNDRLNGGEGRDILNGRGGFDRLNGASGEDQNYGGNVCSTDVHLANAGAVDLVSGTTVTNFGYGAGSWRVDRHPRMIGDFNGDGRDDIIGFGGDHVIVSTSLGSDFSDPTSWKQACVSDQYV